MALDGVRIPSWIAGPLVVAAVIAGASGLITAWATAGDVEVIKGEMAKDAVQHEEEKRERQQVRERIVRIETKIDQIEENQSEQKSILEEIREEVKKP